jgi:HEAT repeat protein
MPYVDRKVVQYHISRLQSRDRIIRLEAISELEDLGHPDALDPLRRVFESDVDMGVRRAAQQAGRAIYVRQLNPEEDQ